MKKTFFALKLFVVLCTLLFTGCGSDNAGETSASQENKYSEGENINANATSNLSYREQTYDPNDTWAIYWYLCGTDLESENGAATSDLQELMEVNLPENVKIVIQTGGTAQWQNELIRNDVIQRHVYDSTGFNTVDEQPLVSMADAATLQGFLEFCETNYPADHKIFLFWDHGGGSVSGAEVDQLFENDTLTLDEMAAAFNGVYKDQIENGSQNEIAAKDAAELKIPYEIIGFDTCLMATVDTAKTFQKYGRYLVASEETEPGNGWYYTQWVGKLAENTATNGALLGKEICDAFKTGCEMVGTQDSITLSVTDLINFPKLAAAYDNLGKEALFYTCENISFLGDFAKGAERSENYGGNNQDEGYTNMVDLGHLVRNNKEILKDNAQVVLDALDECVVYKINSPYRTEATGLSCYYSYDGDEDAYGSYAKVAASQAFKYLYQYNVFGEMRDDGYEYITSVSDYTELPKVTAFEEELPITIGDDGGASLNISADKLDLIKGVYFDIFYYDEEGQQLFMLGSDNNIDADWENGVFKDRFDGTWAALDGHLVYMELTYEGEGYNTYAVPIKLNGEEYNLKVVYDYNLNKYIIMGATQSIDETTGMADKNLVKLKEGDEITTILYTTDISDNSNDEITQVDVEKFKIGANPVFEDISLGDGKFAYMFEVKDIKNKVTYSDVAMFTSQNGQIFTE